MPYFLLDKYAGRRFAIARRTALLFPAQGQGDSLLVLVLADALNETREGRGAEHAREASDVYVLQLAQWRQVE